MSAQTMELLAPAGDFDTARVAFAAGADAVYCGMTSFSARADAKNFTMSDLRGLLAYARSFTPAKKVYVTFNTVVDEAQLDSAVETLAELEDAGPDALIVQDLGVARIVRESFPGLALHASTQLVAHNLEGVLAMRDLGFSRVVLARELSAAEIASIADRCGVELEVFVHGALCYSISGLCLFSAMEKNRSGNRGQCAYCCRLGYADATGAKSLPFSMRDLRLDRRLAQLEEAGVASLKIEGRMKSPVYVGSVTKHYRMLLDAMYRGAQTDASASREDMETVFSRRTTELYISGRPSADNPVDGESLGHLGAPIGKVKRVTRDREGRAWLRFHTSRALEKHDGLQFLVTGGKPCGFGCIGKIICGRVYVKCKPCLMLRMSGASRNSVCKLCSPVINKGIVCIILCFIAAKSRNYFKIYVVAVCVILHFIKSTDSFGVFTVTVILRQRISLVYDNYTIDISRTVYVIYPVRRNSLGFFITAVFVTFLTFFIFTALFFTYF